MGNSAEIRWRFNRPRARPRIAHFFESLDHLQNRSTFLPVNRKRTHGWSTPPRTPRWIDSCIVVEKVDGQSDITIQIFRDDSLPRFGVEYWISAQPSVWITVESFKLCIGLIICLTATIYGESEFNTSFNCYMRNLLHEEPVTYITYYSHIPDPSMLRVCLIAQQWSIKVVPNTTSLKVLQC